MASHRGIVVGVDGSPESESAVEWAAREALLHGVPLTLAHVLPTAQALTWYEVSVSGELDEIAQRRAREILHQATLVAEQAVADDGPITISEHVEEGNATKTMVDLSKDAQLLVVGNRGLGRVGRALLGSVSSGLIHHAHCPVAVVHEQADATMQSEQAPVVVGVDGSPASETAVAVAFDEASRRAVPLVAVHAWSDPTIYAFPNEEWMTLRPRPRSCSPSGWPAGRSATRRCRYGAWWCATGPPISCSSRPSPPSSSSSAVTAAAVSPACCWVRWGPRWPSPPGRR